MFLVLGVTHTLIRRRSEGGLIIDQEGPVDPANTAVHFPWQGPGDGVKVCRRGAADFGLWKLITSVVIMREQLGCDLGEVI